MTAARTEVDAVGLQISENVNTLVHRAGLKQQQLAHAVGMTGPTLSRRMAGIQPWLFWEVQAIADYFSVTLEEITTALPTREEWEGRRVVHPLGLEPRTQCFRVLAGGRVVNDRLTADRRPRHLWAVAS